MVSKVKNQQKGFTIIEVLIVLAIAGLIMLVVFLAVPALQRNSRNTQRSNDVSNLLGALQEYINNSNGTAPVGNAVPGPLAAVKMTQLATVNYNVVASGANATLPATINPDTVLVRNNLKCNNSYNSPTSNGTTVPTTVGTQAGNIANTQGATTRTFVAIYPVEVTGGLTGRCLDM